MKISSQFHTGMALVEILILNFILTFCNVSEKTCLRSLNGLGIHEFYCTKLTGKKLCNNEALAEMERQRRLE